jgi:hypothetical protein
MQAVTDFFATFWSDAKMTERSRNALAKCAVCACQGESGGISSDLWFSGEEILVSMHLTECEGGIRE